MTLYTYFMLLIALCSPVYSAQQMTTTLIYWKKACARYNFTDDQAAAIAADLIFTARYGTHYPDNGTHLLALSRKFNLFDTSEVPRLHRHFHDQRTKWLQNSEPLILSLYGEPDSSLHDMYVQCFEYLRSICQDCRPPHLYKIDRVAYRSADTPSDTSRSSSPEKTLNEKPADDLPQPPVPDEMIIDWLSAPIEIPQTYIPLHIVKRITQCEHPRDTAPCESYIDPSIFFTSSDA